MSEEEQDNWIAKLEKMDEENEAKDGEEGNDMKVEEQKETKDKKTPLGEFILSYFDRENGGRFSASSSILLVPIDSFFFLRCRVRFATL